MALVLVLLNSLAVSVSNVLGGVSAQKMPLPVVIVIAGPASLLAAVAYASVFSGNASAGGLLLGFAAGVVGGIGLPLAFAAFARGPVGSVGAVIALTTTALITAAGIAAGEPLSLFRAIGLALCLPAVLLVTYTPKARTSTAGGGLRLAFPAAALFAGFVLLIDRSPAQDGLWPVVGARIGVTAVAVIIFCWWAVKVRGRPRQVPRGAILLLPVLVGLLDVTGNLLLVFALQAGDLLLLAILAPAAPIFTAIIGRLFLSQRLSRYQVGGLVVASAALPFASL